MLKPPSATASGPACSQCQVTLPNSLHTPVPSHTSQQELPFLQTPWSLCKISYNLGGVEQRSQGKELDKHPERTEILQVVGRQRFLTWSFCIVIHSFYMKAPFYNEENVTACFSTTCTLFPSHQPFYKLCLFIPTLCSILMLPQLLPCKEQLSCFLWRWSLNTLNLQGPRPPQLTFNVYTLTLSQLDHTIQALSA